ncbi:MAG TPA: hypothetical protein VFB72_04625 [Verrucomicrobiae bacterium]|nr:hypothetical protein [Verrucomicrobiae bacterium]
MFTTAFPAASIVFAGTLAQLLIEITHPITISKATIITAIGQRYFTKGVSEPGRSEVALTKAL